MCVTKSNLPRWITGEEETVEVKMEHQDGVNGHGSARLRRKSTVVDDGNEIVLPELDKSGEKAREKEKPDSVDFVSRGGSCIVSPLGEVIAGPLWDDENGLLTVDVDFDDCLRGRLDLDVGGSYSR